jgi:FMN phosphatase YigB (HAD superfamily)
MNAILLDAIGVIYSNPDNITSYLCPIVFKNGGIQDTDEMIRIYRLASTGAISTNDFWNMVGVDRIYENEYINQFTLTEGILTLLNELNYMKRDIYCLSNDISEWSQKLKCKFKLEKYIIDFIISGDVGFRKPDRSIYEILIKRIGKKPNEIIFVDDRIRNLETASILGMQTILFTSNKENETNKYVTAHNVIELKECILNIN